MPKSFSTIGTINVEDTPDSDRHSLSELDLLNLRLTVSSSESENIYFAENKRNIEKQQTEENCGDNFHIKNTVSKTLDHPLKNIKTSLLQPKLPHFESKQQQFGTNINPQYISDFVVTEISEHDFLFPSKKKSSKQAICITKQNPSADFKEKKSKYCQINEGFPFKYSPSGNLLVSPRKVVFSTNKLSLLVADPENTKISIDPESSSVNGANMARHNHETGDILKSRAMQGIIAQDGITSLGSWMENTPTRTLNKESSEYEGKDTADILNPEINLGRLGYSGMDAISWDRIELPEKKNLYLELFSRITNYKNTDCKVYIDGHEFDCHLIVLQCYSQLFDAYIAVKKVEIPADKCSPTAFAFIYDWMITGEPSYRDLNRENVLDIFIAAKYLKVRDLESQCWVFIDNRDVFNENTAFMLYMEAKHRKLPEIQELMLPRIKIFFLMLVSSKDWLEMELVDVKNLLKSNYIYINCEMEIFMSAVRWLKHDWKNRDCFKYEVLECVRFGNIAPWQLVDIKKNSENPDFLELANDAKICKMIDDGLNYGIIKYFYDENNDYFRQWSSSVGLNEPSPRNWSGNNKTYFTYREFLIYLDQYRRNQFIEIDKPQLKNDNIKYGPDVSKKQIRATTSTGQDKLSLQVPSADEFLCKRKNKKQIHDESNAAKILQSAYKLHRNKINKMKDFKCERIQNNTKEKEILELFRRKCLNKGSSTLYSNKKENAIFSTETILIFGGLDTQTANGVGRNTAKNIYSYTVEKNCWEYIGDLPQPRQYHNTSILNGRIYLAGGCDPRMKNSKPLDTVWSYNPTNKIWYEEKNMLMARKNFGLVVVNGCLYAIGGRGLNNECLNCMEKYEPNTRIWVKQSSMMFGRVGAGYAYYMDFIWAAGGICEKNVLKSVETYDVKNDRWSEVTSLHFARSFGSMFVISNQLYIIGGVSNIINAKATECTSLGQIDVWNQSLNDWEYVTELAIARHCHCVTSLGSQIFIIAGITKNYSKTLSSTECFCTERRVFVRGVASLPNPVSGLSAVTYNVEQE